MSNLSILKENKNKINAFTIVELTVVIVIIGILAAIVLVSYNNIRQNAIEVALQSDLDNASKQMKLYLVENRKYPTKVGCPTDKSEGSICLTPSNGNTFSDYKSDNTTSPKHFQLSANHGTDASYRITDSSAAIACPAGYIIVPGSSVYGTSDFCVMKYEAKKDVDVKAVSVATGSPWVQISQEQAESKSSDACRGCHLITEKEWLTIMRNVLSEPSNWCYNTVGLCEIYSGHSGNNPGNALAADTDDSNGYAGIVSPDSYQRRTLRLSNGEVIWDFAGNVYEWTNGQASTGKPGNTGNNFDSWIEWKDINVAGSLSPSATLAATGIKDAGTWSAAEHHVGKLLSSPSDTTLRAFARGGNWSVGSASGVAALNLSWEPDVDWLNVIGFRVVR